MKTRESILLEHCANYQAGELGPRVRSMLEHLVDCHVLGGQRILLKPNLISSRGPALACTSGEIIAQVARFFVEHGARVSIGDSPAFGTTRSVLASQGIVQCLAGLPVELVRFATPVTRELDDGRQVQIAAEALECDLLVNLPRLKAHNQLYVTCAVKNFFGTVVGVRKAMVHMRRGMDHDRFGSLLLDLPGIFPNHISLVDGIAVMHRSGPMDGERMHLGCLAASRCPLALDTVLMHILGLDAAKSPIWQAAQARNHPGATVDNCVFPLAAPWDFAPSGFLAPEILTPVRFSPLRLLVSAAKRMMLAIRE